MQVLSCHTLCELICTSVLSYLEKVIYHFWVGITITSCHTFIHICIHTVCTVHKLTHVGSSSEEWSTCWGYTVKDTFRGSSSQSLCFLGLWEAYHNLNMKCPSELISCCELGPPLLVLSWEVLVTSLFDMMLGDKEWEWVRQKLSMRSRGKYDLNRVYGAIARLLTDFHNLIVRTYCWRKYFLMSSNTEISINLTWSFTPTN